MATINYENLADIIREQGLQSWKIHTGWVDNSRMLFRTNADLTPDQNIEMMHTNTKVFSYGYFIFFSTIKIVPNKRYIKHTSYFRVVRDNDF